MIQSFSKLLVEEHDVDRTIALGIIASELKMLYKHFL